MKKYLSILLLFAISCKFDRVDPSVDTLRVEALLISADREANMAAQLYDHYTKSDKSKEFYEVITNKSGEILNYWPNKKLLTVCADPGSGWLRQYTDIDTAKLKWISDSKIAFRQYEDSLTVSRPLIRPKTNGNP